MAGDLAVKTSRLSASSADIAARTDASSRRRGADAKPRPLQVVTSGCETVADAEPQALGLTYWFDAASDGEPYPVTIRFAGRRIGVTGKPTSRDSFSLLETVDRIVPAGGRIAITTRVYDVAPGEWQVSASPVAEPRRRGARPGRAASKRGASLPPGSASGRTGFAPVIRVRAPGARLAAWPALVSLGVVVALVVQALLAADAGLQSGRVLLVSLIASLIGLVSAKVYYLALHRGEAHGLLTVGMCIQGFVLGAIGTLVAGALLAGIPVGRLLDVTAPGLLFAMAIGRWGCFLGGCCAGRPSASRRALWSSDKRLGTRRIPTQLFESMLAGTLGVAALLAVWLTTPHPAGVVFIDAIAAYTLGRQLLFPLRDLRRQHMAAPSSRWPRDWSSPSTSPLPCSPERCWLSTARADRPSPEHRQAPEHGTGSPALVIMHDRAAACAAKSAPCAKNWRSPTASGARARRPPEPSSCSGVAAAAR